MIKSGLVSITFRQLDVAEIIKLVATAGMDAIEWGGDKHVPHGDIATAIKVRKMCEKAGIISAAYGSYFKVGCDNDFSFQAVLDTAVELNVPTIRVWAGNKASKDADREYWEKFVIESRKIADMAQKEKISVSFEFHRKTLTDTNESAIRLLKDIAHENIKSYWQPPIGADIEYCTQGIKMLTPWLSNIHVFNWDDRGKRNYLQDGISKWKTYLNNVSDKGNDRYALLEFVIDHDPDAFLKDANTLINLLSNS